MQHRFTLLLLSFTVVLFFIGCESTHQTSSNARLLPTGKTDEIVVVCEQSIWESEIKNYLDTGLTRFITPYFPDVVTFELIHRVPTNFEGGMRRHRNVLFITIDPAFKPNHALIEKRRDVWADDQLIIDITGRDYNQVLDVCKAGLTETHAEFDAMSWQRIMKDFKQNSNQSAVREVKKNFGIEIAMPLGAKIVTKRPNFYRIEFPTDARPIEFVGQGQDPGSIFTGVMVYQYPFNDSTQLTPENLLMARDTMLKYNVPYHVDGMYMGTQYSSLVTPEWSTWKNADASVSGTEIRGMFVFKGLPRFGTGGAFWEFHFVHPSRNKVVCVSTYVDAPPTASWTHFIRECEAIMKSVQLIQ